MSPVRRTFWISAARPTVKASTRRLGRLTDTWPEHSGSLITVDTTSPMPEKSALDSDVRVTSS